MLKSTHYDKEHIPSKWLRAALPHLNGHLNQLGNSGELFGGESYLVDLGRMKPRLCISYKLPNYL